VRGDHVKSNHTTEIGFMTDLSDVAEIRSVRVPAPPGDPGADDHGFVEVSVAEAGVGGRPLLLVHGFTGAKEDFRDVVGPLAAEGWWVVAPDLRGHGSSAHPAHEDAYGIDLFAADMVGLVDDLRWDRFDLLGHSMGGMIAQVVALGAQDRISRLVLMDTATGSLDGSESGSDENVALMRLGIELCRAEGIGAIAAVLEMGDQPLDSPAHARLAELPEWRLWESKKFLACSPEMWCAMVETFLTVEDRMESLSALSMPTLVMVGEQDRPFLKVSKRMAETIPGAELVVIPDAGHSPQFENPHAWYSAVSGFLAR